MKGRGVKGDRRRRVRLTARMRDSEDASLHLPLDLDRPHFVRHAGSPALTLSLHRRTVRAPLRTRGPLTDGRKAGGKQREMRRQRTDERWSRLVQRKQEQ